MEDQAVGASSGPVPSGPVPSRGYGRGRGRQAGMDMIRSMGLVALVLGAWMWFSHPRTPEAINQVDWWPVALAASDAAPYPVVAPPEGFAWPATSARVEPQPDGTVVWRVGYYTAAEDYAALLQRGAFPEQAQGSIEEWIAAETREGVAGPTVTIGGREWVRMEGLPTPDERRSLVAVEDGTVTVVTGSAQWAELEQFAAALQPVS